MRIVAGEFRSRTLSAVEGSQTRPTLDRVKEAIFSSIGPFFDGGILLDAYAGSGNISFESLSRGIKESYLCDISGKAIATIKKNAAALQVEDRCHIYKRDVFLMLDQFVRQGLQFDLVYMDPPYRLQRCDALMEALVQKNLLAPSAIVIVESLKEDGFAEAHGDLQKQKESTYGITKITYYRRREL